MKKISTETLLAEFISIILNPLLVITVVFIFANLKLIDANPGPFFFFIAIGAAPVFLLYINELVKHKTHLLHFISIPRENRDKLYLLTVYCFILNAIFFANFQLTPWMLDSLLFTIFAAAMYLSNKYIDKASLHIAVISFSAMYLADKVNLSYAFIFFILPMVFWARIELHKHTWLQLMLGACIGMSIGLLSWTIK